MPSPIEWSLRIEETQELQGPLQNAILWQGVKEVKALVNNGAPLLAEFHLDGLGKDTGNALDLIMVGKRYELAMQLLKLEEPPGTELARTARRAVAWAARDGRTQILQELLLHGADPSQEDEQSRSALLLAAMRGHGLCVNALLEAGAWDREKMPSEVKKWSTHWKLQNPIVAPALDMKPQGETPTAVVVASPEAKLVTDGGTLAKPNDLQVRLLRAMTSRGVREVKALVEMGAPLIADYDLDDLGKHHGSALDLAILHRRYEVALFLVKLEAPLGPELIAASPYALAWSARDGREVLVQELLQRGADAGQCDAEGRSALNLATLRGHKPCVKILLAEGAWDKERKRGDVLELLSQWKFNDLIPTSF